MSKRDQALLQLISLPISQVAENLGKTPQALRKGVKLEREYFSANDVAKIVQFFATHEPKLAGFLRERLKKEYPEYPQLLGLIPDRTEPPMHDSADINRNSEYWVVSPDFWLFLSAADGRLSERTPRLSFSEMLLETESTAVFFISPTDEPACRKYIQRAGLERRSEIYHHRGPVQLLPTLVVQTRRNGSVTLLLATEAGFEAPASSPLEAGRLKAELMRVIYEKGAPSKIQGEDREPEPTDEAALIAK